MTEPLPCIVCKKKLDSVWPELDPQDARNMPANQPHAGTAFTSHGHYGSTVFDPMDGSFLEINICDDCLTNAGKAGHVLAGEPAAPRRSHFKAWEPCR